MITMKKLLTVLLLACAVGVAAQTARYTADGKTYIVDTSTGGAIRAESTWGRFIQITFRTPSSFRKERFDVFTLKFYSTESGVYPLGIYPLGKDAEKLADEKGSAEAKGTWLKSAKNEFSIDSYMIENSRGYLNITYVKGGIMSGDFKVNIDGTIITGEFKDVPVKNLKD